MAFVRFAVLLALLCFSAVSCLNHSVCNPVEKNFGYFPPEPPFNFIMKYRQTDNLDKHGDTVNVEVYVDVINQRILEIHELTGSVTKREIRDYKNKQYIAIYVSYLNPSETTPFCFIDTMEKYKWSINYGLHLIRYGMYNMKQDKTDKVRGIPVYDFNGCFYEEHKGRTWNVTYSWTVSPEYYISEFGVEAPFKARFVGGYNNGYHWISKDYTWEIYWYEKRAAFTDEEFEIPADYMCHASGGRVNLKKVKHHSYSAKHEIMTQYKENGNYVQDLTNFNIWRNDKLDLTKVEYYASNAKKGEGKYFFMNRVSSIHDFKDGLAYIMSLNTYKCKIVPLSYITSDSDIQDFDGLIHMSGPLSIFEKHTWSFKVQENYRSIPVNIYISDVYHGDSYQGRKAVSVIELSFVQPGWTEYTLKKEKMFLPIRVKKHYHFRDHKDPRNVTLVSNMYDLTEKTPSLDEFTAKFYCLRGLETQTFSFRLNGTSASQEDIGQYLFHTFKNDFHEEIAKVASISLLRVQVYQVYKTKTKEYGVYGAIYEAPKITDKPKDRKAPVSLKTAVFNLKSAVDNRQFTVELKLPKLFSKTQIIAAIPGSFDYRL